MNRNLKYLLLTILIVFLFAGYQLIKQSGIKAYKYVNNRTMDYSISDGQYNGSFNLWDNLVLAKVEFGISNGNIDTFAIPYLIDSPFKNVKKSVQDSIYKDSTLQFDAVSGATRSSFFVKAAILEAISKKDSTINNK